MHEEDSCVTYRGNLHSRNSSHKWEQEPNEIATGTTPGNLEMEWREPHVVVANVGDSQALLCRTGADKQEEASGTAKHFCLVPMSHAR